MIAALFVEAGGVYTGLPDVDAWTVDRDARLWRSLVAEIAWNSRADAAVRIPRSHRPRLSHSATCCSTWHAPLAHGTPGQRRRVGSDRGA